MICCTPPKETPARCSLSTLLGQGSSRSSPRIHLDNYVEASHSWRFLLFFLYHLLLTPDSATQPLLPPTASQPAISADSSKLSGGSCKSTCTTVCGSPSKGSDRSVFIEHSPMAWILDPGLEAMEPKTYTSAWTPLDARKASYP
jgi:hypothetical protein